MSGERKCSTCLTGESINAFRCDVQCELCWGEWVGIKENRKQLLFHFLSPASLLHPKERLELSPSSIVRDGSMANTACTASCCVSVLSHLLLVPIQAETATCRRHLVWQPIGGSQEIDWEYVAICDVSRPVTGTESIAHCKTVYISDGSCRRICHFLALGQMLQVFSPLFLFSPLPNCVRRRDSHLHL